MSSLPADFSQNSFEEGVLAYSFFRFVPITTAERDALPSPPTGVVIFNSSANKLQVRVSGGWSNLH